MPSINTTLYAGWIAHADPGSWGGDAGTYSYQWQSCQSSDWPEYTTTCNDIPGATSTSYTVQQNDVGNELQAQVTDTNDAGSDSQVSFATTVSSDNADPVPSAYSSSVLNDDPGSFWQLNDPVGSTAAQDVVNNDPSDPAVASGTPTFAEPGITDGMTSVGLTGGASFNVDDLMQFGDFTIEAWVKTTNDNEPIFTNSANCSAASFYYQSGIGCTGSTWSLNVVGGKLQAEVPMSDGSTMVVTNNTSIADGEWHQISLIVDPLSNNGAAQSEVTVQVDESEIDTSRSLVGFNSGLTSLQIGGSSVLAPESFIGQLADVSFYPEGLDPNELYLHYLAAQSADPIGATNTQLPTISGNAAVGSTLVATPGQWITSTGTSPGYSYQWLSCDTTGNNCQAITGATGASYQVTNADANTTLTVQVKASTDAGDTYADSSAFAVALAPVNTSPPTIIGSATIGSTITANHGLWSETGSGISYSYQWQTCSEMFMPPMCSNLNDGQADDTQAAFTISNSLSYDYLRVVVTATDSNGSQSADSTVTAEIMPAAPINTVQPTIAGTAQAGRYLTVASQGQWSPSNALTSIQGWQVCTSNGNNCQPIAANNPNAPSQLLVTDSMVGEQVRAIITAFNPGSIGSATAYSNLSSIIIARPTDVPTIITPPTVTGHADVGWTLQANIGSWGGQQPLNYSYQWQRCQNIIGGMSCTNISGATNVSYVVQASDQYSLLQVQVTASNAAGSDTETSWATSTVTNGPAPSAYANAVLNDNASSWWQLNEPIGSTSVTNAVSSTITPVSGQPVFGQTGIFNGITSASFTPTDSISAASNNLAISGAWTAEAWVKTTASAEPVLQSTPTVCPICSSAVPWQIDLAGGQTQVSVSLPGTTLQAAGTTSINDGLWHQVVVTFNPTTTFGSSGLTYSATLTIFVDGVEDGTTTVSLPNQPGSGNSTLQLGGAESNPLVGFSGSLDEVAMYSTALSPTQVFTHYQAAGGYTPTLPTNTTAPSITGTFAVGNTLQANPGVWTGSGPITYRYQWSSCNSDGSNCQAITGAAGSSYQVVNANLDQKLVARITAHTPGGDASAATLATTITSETEQTNDPTSEVFAFSANVATASFQCRLETGGSWSNWTSCQSGQTYTGLSSGNYQFEVAASAAGVTEVDPPSYSWTVAASSGPPVNATVPTISGTPETGQQLTATSGTWSGLQPIVYNYQWQTCSGSVCSNISGATNITYTPTNSNIGAQLQVDVLATNNDGSVTAISTSTNTVINGAPVNTAPPTIAGTPEVGATFTASPGTWSSVGSVTYQYQWERCNSAGASCQAITNATSANYVAQGADIGNTVEVQVTATTQNAATTAVSATSSLVPAMNTTITAESSVSNNPTTMQFSFSAYAVNPSYQCRLEAGGTWTAWSSCTSPDAYTGLTDGAHSFQVEAVAGGVTDTPANYNWTVVQPPVDQSPAIISGTVETGQRLSAAPGNWSGLAPISYSYQWQSCTSTNESSCSNIIGANNPTYLIPDNDGGVLYQVVVSASNADSLAPVVVTTAITAPTIAAPAVSTQQPQIAQVLAVGQTANNNGLNFGTWSPTDTTVTFDAWWLCDADGNNCTRTNWTEDQAFDPTDQGDQVYFTVDATNNNTGRTVTVASNNKVIAAELSLDVPPTVSGAAKPGSTLSADTGNWSSSDSITYAYQWERCDNNGNNCNDIAGATNDTYTLQPADTNNTIAVRVVATTSEGVTNSSTSLVSAVVLEQTPVNTGQPTITGTAQDQQTLTADPGNWSGDDPKVFTYQWQTCSIGNTTICASIAGATGTSYQVQPQDIGFQLQVVVSASNDDGTSQASSESTSTVTGAPPTATAAPMVNGSMPTTAGDSLFATTGQWSGDGPISYMIQWRQCNLAGDNCTDITNTGPTPAMYTTSSSNAGAVVQVQVTASNIYGQSSSSSNNIQVVAPATSSPTSNTTSTGSALAPDGNGGFVAVGQSSLESVNAEATIADFQNANALNVTFGSSGYENIIEGPDSDAQVQSVITAPDGDFLIGGTSQQTSGLSDNDTAYMLTRLLPDGHLDRTFGGGSGAIFPVIDNQQPTALGQTSNGQILLAGMSGNEPVVAQYNANGSLDNAINAGVSDFGTQGVATINISTNIFNNIPNVNSVLGVSIDKVIGTSDGDIYVDGFAKSYMDNGNFQRYLYVARLTSTGQLDDSYGNNGIALAVEPTNHNIDITPAGMTREDDGSIVVTGTAGTPGTASEAIVMVHFTANGVQDTSFGTDSGWTWDSEAAGASASSIGYADNVGPDGDQYLFVGGAVTQSGQTNANQAIVRYTINGLVSTNYGTDGVATSTDMCGPVDCPSSWSQILVASDGSINAVGQGTPDEEADDQETLVRHITSAGVEEGIPPYAFGSNLSHALDPLQAGVAGNSCDEINPDGAVELCEHDFTLAGTGLPIDFTRYYSSLNAREDGPFGHGWRYSYESNLDVSNGTMIVDHEPDGAVDYFERDADGSNEYTSPAGDFDSLTKNSNGTWTLQRENTGVDWNYSSTGQLETVIDQEGNTLHFAYNTDNTLHQITNQSGRSVTFNYSEGLIDSVTETGADGTSTRTFVYDYTDSHDNLNKAFDGNGMPVTYDYDTTNNDASNPYLANEMTGRNTPSSPNNLATNNDPGNDEQFSYYTPSTNNGKNVGMLDTYQGSNDLTGSHFDQEQLYYSLSGDATTEVNQDNQPTTYITNAMDQTTTIEEPQLVTGDNPCTDASLCAPVPATTSYSYDLNGDVTSYTNEDGQTTTYGYDGDGHASVVLQPAPNTGDPQPKTTATYNGPFGELTQLVNPDGATINDSYYPDGQLETHQVDGGTTFYAYYPDGQLETENDPFNNAAGIGPTTTYYYDTTGNLTSEVTAATNADNHQTSETTSYTPDTWGNIHTVTAPLGQTTSYSYDGNNNLLTTSIYASGVDPATGTPTNTTTNVYDDRNNLIEQTVADSTDQPQISRWNYTPTNNQASATDARGNTSTYSYNDLDQLSQTTLPSGNFTNYGYDPMGRVVSETHPYGSSATVSRADAPLATSNTVYNADGTVAQTLDADGNSTLYQYDYDGNLTYVTDGLSNITHYTYYPSGLLHVADDPDGLTHTTTYVYNANDLLKSKTDALSNQWQYSYYPDGSLETTTDPDSRTVTDDYDGAGNPTDVISADSAGNATSTIHTAYDENEDPTTVTDDSGTTTYAPNSLGELHTAQLPNGKTLTYGYDGFGNTTSVQLSGQAATQYGYNPDNQVDQLTDPDGNVTLFDYTVDDQPWHEDLPTQKAGTTYSYGYDNLVSNIASTDAAGDSTSKLSYTYDPNGNTTNVTDSSAGGEDGAFGYDALNRLVSEQWTSNVNGAAGNVNETAGYTYDAAGNRTQAVINGVATQSKYNADNELTTSTNAAGTTNYGYNNEDELTSKTFPDTSQINYGYNILGQLTSVDSGSGSANYTYDAAGNRVGETSNGSTTDWVYDETGASGSAESPIASITNPNGATPTVTADEQGPFGIVSSETNDQASSQVYYQQDALGSTVSTLNSAGSQPEHYSYTAFGQPLTSSGATPEFGFMGEETNPASETDNFHARSYSAADGSFLSPDPLAGNLMLPQSLDQYVYGGDNPFANPDPFGESWLGDAVDDFIEGDAGAVDWLTFGATADARDALGDNNVDTSSAAYEIGEGVGAVAGEFLPGEDELDTARIVERGEEAADDVEDTEDAIQPINGRMPINSSYAGSDFPLSSELAEKYPDGVQFNEQGFPDFSPYAKDEVQPEGLNGKMPHDEILANREAGLDTTSPGYTWHHNEDGQTMQQVPTELHSYVRHTGGAAILRGGG